MATECRENMLENKEEQTQQPEEEEEEEEEEGDEDPDSLLPIDRGWAWIIVLGCFLVQFIVLGVAKCFGILFVEITEKFNSEAGETTGIVSLNAMLAMSLGPLATTLGMRFTNRVVITIGGLLFALGFIISGFAPNIGFLYFSFGIISGIGIAFCYAPSIVAVAEYFIKRRALANGISIAGSGLGNLLIPLLFHYMLENWSLQGALIMLGGISLHVCVSGLLMRPISFYLRFESLRIQRRDARRVKRKRENGHAVGGRGDVRNVEGVDLDTSGTANVRLLDKSVSISSLAESGIVKDVLHKNSPYLFNSRLHSSNPHLSSTTTSHLTCRRKSGSHDHLHQVDKSPSNGHISVFYGGPGGAMHASIQSIPQYVGTGRELTGSHPHQDDGDNQDDTDAPSSCCQRMYHRLCFLPKQSDGSQTSMFDWDLLWNPVFSVICLSVIFSSMGYTACILMVPPNAKDLGLSKGEAAILVSIMGGADLVGRILFGWFSDFNIIPKHYGYMVTMMASGIVCFIYPVLETFWGQAVVTLLFGLFGGSYIALIPVLLVEWLGPERLPNAFGLSVMGQGVSIVVAFSIVGYSRDVTESWDMSFYMAAVSIVIGAGLILLLNPAQRYMDRRSSKHSNPSTPRPAEA